MSGDLCVAIWVTDRPVDKRGVTVLVTLLRGLIRGVALIGLFIVAWLLVGDKGRKLLPGLHRTRSPHLLFAARLQESSPPKAVAMRAAS